MKRILKTLSVLLTVAMVVLFAGLTISAAEKPELSSSELTLAVGYSGKLTVSGDYKSIEWTSSDESVCTVKNGKVTAVSTGKATVTAKDDSCKLTCKVKVYKSCFGEYSPQSVKKGKTLTMKIPAYYEDPRLRREKGGGIRHRYGYGKDHICKNIQGLCLCEDESTFVGRHICMHI